ncbi:MAG TPA: hypothetical protein DHV17_04240 [Chitinophagaceae bacterium]|nr:hypothetical protein [Chitinophagaceae bacterium]
MIEQLMQLIQTESTETVINNPEVPNEYNESVMQEAGASVTTTLQNMLASGQAKEVMSLFKTAPDQVGSHPAAQQISGNFMSSIMEKFGLNSGAAGNIAGSLIPMVLGKLVGRTNDPNDSSMNIQDIFNGLSNNRTSGIDIGSIFSKFSGGLDKDGDGDVDLSDITSMFSGGSGSGGGILDQLKGMLGGRS